MYILIYYYQTTTVHHDVSNNLVTNLVSIIALHFHLQTGSCDIDKEIYVSLSFKNSAPDMGRFEYYHRTPYLSGINRLV
jgi:hypothetical protein